MNEVFGKPCTSEITGESWELSTVKGDVSVIANGYLADTTLQELIEKFPNEILGKSVVQRFGTEFPILIKFIDAKQDLSIQLHPNDQLAKERHDSFGKTEMWYIMDADPGAELIVGFNRDVSRVEYEESLKNDSLLELLNYEKVVEGDTFFINTGKIHAIGAGVLLAEIQQTSDVTYRVFDFNRRDKDGNLRELHTDLALDAIDYERKNDFKVDYSKESNSVNTMVECPYFKTNYLNLTESMVQDTLNRDSFTIFMCVDGEAAIENEFGKVNLRRGETTLVPGITEKITINTNGAKLLEVTI